MIAQRLAELGANIILHDKDWIAPAQYSEADNLGVVEEGFQTFGVKTLAVTCDIGDSASVSDMKKKSCLRWVRLIY